MKTCAFLLYAVLTVVVTWPLAPQIASIVPNDLGDPVLNTWILWWNAHTLPLTSTWWNAPAFYPAGGSLGFSEHLLGISLFASPVQWLGGSPLLAYNLAFLLSFVLSAFFACLLVRELTGRWDAALIGGLLFGFAPYRMSHLAHLQVLSSYWMPLSLLGLHKYLREGRAAWLGLFGGAWLLQALANGYYMFFFSILVTLWVAWFAWPWPRRRIFTAIVGAWALAAVPLIPILLRYRAIHDEFGFGRGFSEIEAFSADVASLLNAASGLAVWGSLRVHDRPESQLFPGATVALLIVAAVVLAIYSGHAPVRTGDRASMVRVALGLLAAVLVLVGLSEVIYGAWRIELFGVRILSIRDPARAFLAAAVLVLVMFGRAAVRAYRARSILGFYAVAAAVMWLLSLGPAPTMMGEGLPGDGLYRVLMLLPGFDAIRVPARFAMLMALCLAVVGAICFARLVPRTGRWQYALAALVSLGVVMDAWPSPIALLSPPPPRAVTRCLPSGGNLVELPLGGRDRDLAAMFRSMDHARPVANGYSGYFPPHYVALSEGLASSDDDVLWELAARGVTYAVVDEGATTGRALSRYVGRHEAAVRLCSDGQQTLYRLTPRPALGRSDTPGQPLPLASVRANVNANAVSAMTDGSPATIWTSGPQSRRTEVRVDLGKVMHVDGVTLSLGPVFYDFPRTLAIDTSEDGQRWEEAWRGTGAPVAFAAALTVPREVPMRFEFPSRGARMVRLRLRRNRPQSWSVAELAVTGRHQ